MCGVLWEGFSPNLLPTGSSPHVRGFGPPPSAQRSLKRFIPACAGFCSTRGTCPKSGRVHPRMCGVLVTQRVKVVSIPGSSPHVRGFVEPAGKQHKSFGFIPACAGFCMAMSINVRSCWVHPRMCGVLKFTCDHRLLSIGSSPHVRGFVIICTNNKHKIRFIPACAGFWSTTARCSRPTQVHPRMCGVLHESWRPTLFSRGSSPHVRGFEHGERPDRLVRGFIPACAGFCKIDITAVTAFLVHPRMCGVLKPNGTVICSRSGSSPHVRGFARHAYILLRR